MLQTQPPNLAR